jgi:hypothetical protein
MTKAPATQIILGYVLHKYTFEGGGEEIILVHICKYVDIISTYLHSTGIFRPFI